MMHDAKKSDSGIVARKAANNGAQARAEPPERRAGIEGNAGGRDTGRTRSRGTVPSGADRVRQHVKEKLTALLHHITPETLGAHDALAYGIMNRKINWVLDADISRFLDRIDRDMLMQLLEKRIGDRRVLRLIRKWLKAGVMDAGLLTDTGEGTPQGSVISPLISNIFLHHVLDKWFEEEAKPRLQGRGQFVRYADDFVMTFADDQSGRRMLAVLGKRLGRFGLTLHATKTRYVDFRPKRSPGHDPGATFDFLGFTHVWGRLRRGYSVVRQITAKSRFARAVKAVNDWCRKHRHAPLSGKNYALCSPAWPV